MIWILKMNEIYFQNRTRYSFVGPLGFPIDCLFRSGHSIPRYQGTKKELWRNGLIIVYIWFLGENNIFLDTPFLASSLMSRKWKRKIPLGPKYESVTKNLVHVDRQTSDWVRNIKIIWYLIPLWIWITLFPHPLILEIVH